ncbi:unnamed protein product [Ceutorhynchus assimilis]|uniref:Uncharacterized protein n=1 Tax=Ceutorhynchus assimilis TaxID=467358 RepID=A0A9N9QNN3_9CUCU|nr:unnamed protein product [Ceutorhynchus assimilis]
MAEAGAEVVDTMTLTGLRKVLSKLKLTFDIPTYLIDLLEYTGFDNITALALFEEEDYKKLEDFAKNDLALLFNDEEKLNFFGIYSRNIPMFKIVEGHKKILALLIKACKYKLESEKKQSLNIPRKRSAIVSNNSNKKRKIIKVTDASTSKEIISSEDLNSSSELLIDTDEDTIQTQNIIDHVKHVVTSYQKKFLNTLNNEEEKNATTLALEKMKVEVKDHCALVQCVKCEFVSKAYCKLENNRKKWVLSNVNRHFKTHFKKNSKAKQVPFQNAPPKNKKLVNTIISFLKGNEDAKEMQDNPSTIQITDINSDINELEQELDLTQVVTQPLNSDHPSTRPSTDLDTDPMISGQNKDGISSDNLNGEILGEISEENFCGGRIAIEEAGSTVSNSAKKSDEFVVAPQKNNLTPSLTPSRRDRSFTKRQLNLDENQLKLTFFFDFCEKLKKKISSDAIVNEQFQLASNVANETIPITGMEAMKKNKSENGGNSKSYETLYANMDSGLPSITTLNRTLTKFGKCAEGDLNIDQLKLYLEKRGYPLKVIISEDQTAIVKRVRYNPTTNQLVGCVPKISKINGFPLENQYKVNSVKYIKNSIENTDCSNNAYVYMAQPLVDGALAFCISIFGSDNRFTSEDVLHRWKYISDEAKKRNISIEGFSSDGDTRCLRAMKLLGGVPSLSTVDNPYSPYFQINYAIEKPEEKPCVFQDTIHIATKIETRLLKKNIILPMGTYFVSSDHLSSLIKDFSKDKHLLNSGDLEGLDKMNFEAIDKLSASCVTDLLLQNEQYKATRQLLVLTRAILDSFIDKSLKVERRVYLIWYVTFFIRLWRNWIKHDEKYTLSKNWLTLNTYTCIEINAHSLLLLIEKCRSSDTADAFLPWLCSSQPCEKFFRQTRSMTSTYLIMVNFDLLDLLQRRHRIQCINDIVSDAMNKSGNDAKNDAVFIFPREENKRLATNPPCHNILPTVEEIKIIMENAKLEAITSDSTNVPDEEADLETEVGQIDPQNMGNEINQEDLVEIEEELNIFNDFQNLKIKDYNDGKNKTHSDNSRLSITVNNKNMIVRKSTLCWLFFDKKGKLSSDRRIRCRGMSSKGEASGKTFKKISRNAGKRIFKAKPKKKLENNKDFDTSSSEDEPDSYADRSSSGLEELTDNEDLDEELPSLTSSKEAISDFSCENYYAVLYDTWYIGRVLEILDQETSKIKFLKSELYEYVWPREDDIQIVEKKYIFYGPIKLIGNGPFRLKRFDKVKIEKSYRELKSREQDLKK